MWLIKSSTDEFPIEAVVSSRTCLFCCLQIACEVKPVLIYSDHLLYPSVGGGVARSDCTGLEIRGSRCGHQLAGVVLGIPQFSSSVTIVNSLRACPLPAGILNHIMFICIVFISSFFSIGPEKPHWGSGQLLFFYFHHQVSCRCTLGLGTHSVGPVTHSASAQYSQLGSFTVCSPQPLPWEWP